MMEEIKWMHPMQLARFPNNSTFLLHTRNGCVHVCRLVGNLPDDESIKAQRMSDGKIIRIERLVGAGVALCLVVPQPFAEKGEK